MCPFNSRNAKYRAQNGICACAAVFDSNDKIRAAGQEPALVRRRGFGGRDSKTCTVSEPWADQFAVFIIDGSDLLSRRHLRRLKNAINPHTKTIIAAVIGKVRAG